MDLLIADFMWLTVMSPEEPHGAQLLLEPDANPAADAYQNAFYETGFPLFPTIKSKKPFNFLCWRFLRF